MTDLTCACMGVDHRTECEQRATGEDGYCDHCRAYGCETSPLAQLLEETRPGLGFDPVKFDEAMARYTARCESEGYQT